jgi:hypothetical protein
MSKSCYVTVKFKLINFRLFFSRYFFKCTSFSEPAVFTQLQFFIFLILCFQAVASSRCLLLVYALPMINCPVCTDLEFDWKKVKVHFFHHWAVAENESADWFFTPFSEWSDAFLQSRNRFQSQVIFYGW